MSFSFIHAPEYTVYTPPQKTFNYVLEVLDKNTFLIISGAIYQPLDHCNYLSHFLKGALLTQRYTEILYGQMNTLNV